MAGGRHGDPDDDGVGECEEEAEVDTQPEGEIPV